MNRNASDYFSDIALVALFFFVVTWVVSFSYPYPLYHEEISRLLNAQKGFFYSVKDWFSLFRGYNPRFGEFINCIVFPRFHPILISFFVSLSNVFFWGVIGKIVGAKKSSFAVLTTLFLGFVFLAFRTPYFRAFFWISGVSNYLIPYVGFLYLGLQYKAPYLNRNRDVWNVVGITLLAFFCGGSSEYVTPIFSVAVIAIIVHVKLKKRRIPLWAYTIPLALILGYAVMMSFGGGQKRLSSNFDTSIGALLFQPSPSELMIYIKSSLQCSSKYFCEPVLLMFVISTIYLFFIIYAVVKKKICKTISFGRKTIVGFLSGIVLISTGTFIIISVFFPVNPKFFPEVAYKAVSVFFSLYTGVVVSLYFLLRKNIEEYPLIVTGIRAELVFFIFLCMDLTIFPISQYVKDVGAYEGIFICITISCMMMVLEMLYRVPKVFLSLFYAGGLIVAVNMLLLFYQDGKMITAYFEKEKEIVLNAKMNKEKDVVIPKELTEFKNKLYFKQRWDLTPAKEYYGVVTRRRALYYGIDSITVEKN